jgi:drug/metabolite transporter (DMT)-like permease
VTSPHSIVFIGLLPLATAIFGGGRGGERPKPTFWVFSALGSVLVAGFALTQGLAASPIGDGLMLAAIIVCGLGYAEGARLSRTLGGWQVISWALVLAGLPMALRTGVSVAQDPPTGTPVDWALFGYLGAVSMFLGFFAWYRGLAIGPMAQVSQVQLAQPVLTVSWAALLLHEQLTWPTVLGGAVVVACAGIAVRSRFRGPGEPRQVPADRRRTRTPGTARAGRGGGGVGGGARGARGGAPPPRIPLRSPRGRRLKRGS